MEELNTYQQVRLALLQSLLSSTDMGRWNDQTLKGRLDEAEKVFWEEKQSPLATPAHLQTTPTVVDLSRKSNPFPHPTENGRLSRQRFTQQGKTMQVINKKVKLQLVGLDGNAFSLMAAFQEQAQNEKWSK